MNTTILLFGLIGLSENYLGTRGDLGWKNENAPVKVALPKPTFCNRSITK